MSPKKRRDIGKKITSATAVNGVKTTFVAKFKGWKLVELSYE